MMQYLLKWKKKSMLFLALLVAGSLIVGCGGTTSNGTNTKDKDKTKDGGKDGGNLLFQGTPEDLVKVKTSHTGHYLKEKL